MMSPESFKAEAGATFPQTIKPQSRNRVGGLSYQRGHATSVSAV